MSERPPATTTLLLVTAAITAWTCAATPIFSQEAYYWTYAQHPALSYFDHPPLVAWMIWLGTAVFGDGAIGIRLGTWCCGMGTAWFGLLLLRDFGVGAVGQRLWLLIGIGCPALVVARVLANPDPGLVCFWTLTLLTLWRARDGKLGWWLLAGIAAGLALLSKYTASFLLPTGFLLFLFDARLRGQLKKPGPYVAVLLAAIVFLPVVIWNVDNHFESFRFQTEGRFSQSHLTTHWIAQLLLSQFGLFNPLLALLLPATLMWSLRRRPERDPRLVLLLAGGLPLPLYMLFQSLWIQVKVNWLTPAYVPLLLLMVLWWTEADRRPLLQHIKRWAVYTMIWLQLLALLTPLARALPQLGGTSWSGWPEIAAAADRERAKITGEFFFFGADYRDSAQLGRSLKMLWREQRGAAAPGKQIGGEPVMAQNVAGFDALQFDHWESPAKHVGQDAVFALTRAQQRQDFVERLRLFFDRVEAPEHIDVTWLGVHVADADIYLCRGYHGPHKD